MLKKIYRELVTIRKELQTKRDENNALSIDSSNTIREPYEREPMEWRRFELLTESEAERERLESVLRRSNLSRQDLAIILFSLRVRPEFGKEHFDI